MKLRISLLFVVIASIVSAQDVTVNVSITMPTEVANAVNAWRAAQKNPDGTAKYATAAALLRSILKETISRILDQTLTASMITEQAKITAANAAIEKLKAAAVQ